jgi:1,3-beta-glucanosyltransferase GAS5
MKSSFFSTISLAAVTAVFFHFVPFVFANDPFPVVKYVQCENSTISNHPVILKGKRFYDSLTGRYFPIKGIAYYPRPNDGSLSVSNSVDFFTDEYRFLWEADLEHMIRLGVNTIRIYAVDPSRNHDAFMCALQRAGIYVMLELLADCEGCNIGPDVAPSCYPLSLKTRGEWIINEFSKYANTLTFSAGNEVTLYSREWGKVEMNAPCQKKFLRDMRAYANTCSEVLNSILPRKVPIGLVNWDYARDTQALYFNCQTNSSDPLETAEWYGMNVYQHCNANDPTLGGFPKFLEDFASYNLSVPVVIAEYGCREANFPTMGDFQAQRTWLQVDAFYSEQYQNVIAGAVAYGYSAEKGYADTSPQGNPWPYFGFMKLNFGVGYYSPVTCDNLATPCTYTPYPEFEILREKLAAVDVSFVPNLDQASEEAGQIPQCPEGFSALWDFEWPTDEDPGQPCHVIETREPTAAPTTDTPSVSPSFAPTTISPLLGPSESMDVNDGNDDNSSNPIVVNAKEDDTSESSSVQAGYALAWIVVPMMALVHQ